MFLYVPEGAQAASLSVDVIPSLRLEQGWTSNVFNTSANELSDFYFRARPEVALQWNTPGAAVKLGASLEGTWYFQNPDANQDPTWNFTLGLNGGEAVQVTQNFSVVPSVYYINTINSYRRTQLLPTGDPVVPQATISTYANTLSQDFGGGLALNYLGTARLSYGLQANYGERRFPGEDTSGLTDSTTLGGIASVSYLFTPKFSAGLGIVRSHQTYENSPDSDIYSAGVLFGYRFSQEFRIDGRLGYSLIRQDATNTSTEQKASDPAGSLDATYAGETLRARGGVAVYYTGVSGSGVPTRQGTAYIGIDDKFAREWSWNLVWSYQITRSVFDTGAVDLTSTYGNAFVNFSPWEWLAMSLVGGFSRQWSDGQFGDPINAYSVALNLNLGTTLKVF